MRDEGLFGVGQVWYIGSPVLGYSQRCINLDEYRGPASRVVVGGEEAVGADSELVEALEEVIVLVGVIATSPSHLYDATPNMSNMYSFSEFQPTSTLHPAKLAPTNIGLGAPPL